MRSNEDVSTNRAGIPLAPVRARRVRYSAPCWRSASTIAPIFSRFSSRLGSNPRHIPPESTSEVSVQVSRIRKRRSCPGLTGSSDDMIVTECRSSLAPARPPLFRHCDERPLGAKKQSRPRESSRPRARLLRFAAKKVTWQMASRTLVPPASRRLREERRGVLATLSSACTGIRSRQDAGGTGTELSRVESSAFLCESPPKAVWGSQ